MKLNLEGAKKTLIERDFPSVIVIESIARCNLRCIMCPYPMMKREKGIMPDEVFHKIVDEIVAEDPDTQLWLAIMGEPLLLGDRLIEMITHARKTGVRGIFLNTNATFLDAEIAGKLIHSGVNKILVSLDAFHKETYDRIRVNGDFDATVKNIQQIARLKKQLACETPEIVVQFIVMKENEHEVESFKEFWLKEGVTVKVRPKLGWGTAVTTDHLNLSEQERNFPCPWLVRELHIHWDGSIVQCDSDYEGKHDLGNVKDKTIKEVWMGEHAVRRRRQWDGDFSHPLCKDCRDWQVGLSQIYRPENESGD